MMRSFKTMVVGSLFAAIFFSGAEFNQVSARIPDTKVGSYDRFDNWRGQDYYSHDGWHDQGDWRYRDNWRGGYYGDYYYGGPGFYYGDGNAPIYVTPGYDSDDYYSQPVGGTVPYYQQGNVPSYQQRSVPSYQQDNVPSYQQDNVPSYQQGNVRYQQDGYAPYGQTGAPNAFQKYPKQAGSQGNQPVNPQQN